MTRSDLTAPPKGEGASKLADMLEEAAFELHDLLIREMRDLATTLGERNAGAQERVTAYAGFFKMLQGVESMTNGKRQQRETQTTNELEVVEFREQLEGAIARLVDTGITGEVSGNSGG